MDANIQELFAWVSSTLFDRSKYATSSLDAKAILCSERTSSATANARLDALKSQVDENKALKLKSKGH